RRRGNSKDDPAHDRVCAGAAVQFRASRNGVRGNGQRCEITFRRLRRTAPPSDRTNSRECLMLVLKPNCECCDCDLPPDSGDARICTFECTFCADCASGVLKGMCPNCGGNFAPRPIRPAAMLAKYPSSAERVKRREPCA